MIAALSAGIGSMGEDSPAHERLVLTREFLLFVDEEMRGLAEKWEQRREALSAGR